MHKCVEQISLTPSRVNDRWASKAQAAHDREWRLPQTTCYVLDEVLYPEFETKTRFK